jgi:hypothetical protein
MAIPLPGLIPVGYNPPRDVLSSSSVASFDRFLLIAQFSCLFPLTPEKVVVQCWRMEDEILKSYKNALPPWLLFSYTLVQEQKPALKNCYY